MAANRFGIDVGQLYRDKENIAGARTRNKMASLQLGEAEREIEQRPIREAATQKRNAMLTDVRSKAATGDDAAQRQLLTIDPEGGASFIKAIGDMDKRKLKSTQRKVDEMGQMAATVLNASPEKQARLYKQMLTTLPPESVAKMPKDLDLNFLEVSLSKAMAMDKILENPKAVTVGGEDILYKQGREIERGKRPVKTGGAGEGGLKSGDESLMYRQAAELLGGMFDAAGNLQALDPQTRTKAQAIATEATKIFQSTKGITRTQAVANAAKLYGIEMPSQVSDNDPLNLR